MEVRIIPFDEKYLDETLAMMRKWSPDHPELGEKSLYDWQRCTRYLAMSGDEVVGHIGQIAHEFRYADGRPPVKLGWGVTLVINMSQDAVRKAAGRLLLKACEDAPGVKYAAVGVVPTIEPAYLRRGHQIVREGSSYFARFFRPEKALAYWGKPTWYSSFAKLAGLFWRPDTTVRHGSLEPVTHFLAEWDPIWDDQMKQQYEFYGVRDADFLNYKLAQPNRQYFAFLHKDSSGAIDGYIIYRRAKHLTRDMDLVRVCDMVGSRTAKRDMLARAMQFALQEAPGTYGIVGLSSSTDEQNFKSTGMFVTRPYPVVLAAGVEGKPHVTLFDSDLDNLW
ncbi:hypothetical protein C3F09_08240 [candidate division GN15 bacterium]|uniref:N-acetyltransferase domain-containing protein n=1 Tax=candidate division GN15 bacterium TaxID=2072418 RepID=A0A855X5Q6_9BACT|nr:MAG: hypothetical protein C3F09_08240 [candidate division GN15 bacterium]